MDKDFTKCCRICLDVETDHVSIIGDPTINLHLKSCLSLTISTNDDLPKSICASCVTQLSEFYNFQLSAHYSQDWLESCLEEKSEKTSGTKTTVQPLPDSEYNSDSLLEFLNNTANIEEYLNNLGREDIPSIVNLLEGNEKSLDGSTKKKEILKQKNNNINMELDDIDPKIDLINDKSIKNIKSKIKITEKNNLICFACDLKCDNMHKLMQHMSVCDAASRTCKECKKVFNSKRKMQLHFLTHDLSEISCYCGKQFQSKEKFMKHLKVCFFDHGTALGFKYSCKECGKNFKERFLLYNHAKEHVSKKEQSVCDICGHRFLCSEALTKHKTKEHNLSNESIFRCKICHMTSTNRSEVYLHVQKHRNTQEVVPHLCESCGQRFSSQFSLSRHLQLHGKRHRNHNCSKTFQEQKMLKEHDYSRR